MSSRAKHQMTAALFGIVLITVLSGIVLLQLFVGIFPTSRQTILVVDAAGQEQQIGETWATITITSDSGIFSEDTGRQPIVPLAGVTQQVDCKTNCKGTVEMDAVIINEAVSRFFGVPVTSLFAGVVAGITITYEDSTGKTFTVFSQVQNLSPDVEFFHDLTVDIIPVFNTPSSIDILAKLRAENAADGQGKLVYNMFERWVIVEIRNLWNPISPLDVTLNFQDFLNTKGKCLYMNFPGGWCNRSGLIEVNINVSPIPMTLGGSQTPDFGLGVSPQQLTLDKYGASSQTMYVVTRSVNGLSGTGTLQFVNFPDGVTIQGDKNVNLPADRDTSNLLTLAASSKSKNGTYMVTVSLTISEVSHTALMTIIIVDICPPDVCVSPTGKTTVLTATLSKQIYAQLEPVAINGRLTDAAALANPISNAEIQIISGANVALTYTGNDGKFTYLFTAPETTGTYNIQVAFRGIRGQFAQSGPVILTYSVTSQVSWIGTLIKNAWIIALAAVIIAIIVAYAWFMRPRSRMGGP